METPPKRRTQLPFLTLTYAAADVASLSKVLGALGGLGADVVPLFFSDSSGEPNPTQLRDNPFV
jgi:hypothetical protein